VVIADHMVKSKAPDNTPMREGDQVLAAIRTFPSIK